MANYFRTKAKFLELSDSGIAKTVVKEYLIQASSWTEAEARTYEFLETAVRGDFEIKKVNDSPIENVIIDDPENFWLVKVKYPSVDDNGKEKYFTTQVVVTAQSIAQAISTVEEVLRSKEIRGFEIVAATQTKISEFYPYSNEED